MATLPFRDGCGVKMHMDALPALREALSMLTRREVLVGFPEDTTQRDEDSAGQSITNASLAYIHDNGAPEQNIPARPFMVPGIMAARPRVEAKMRQIAKAVVALKPGVVEQGLTQIGLIAQAAIRAQINAGVPPPLSEATLRDRARRGRKGAKQELANRAQGLPASTALAKPLVDTAQMRNAVNYVIREKRARG